MTLSSILNTLTGDSALDTLLGSSTGDSRIYPNHADYARLPAVVYTFAPATDDKVRRQDRLEFHIIAKTLSSALAIDARIRALLLTLGDNGADQISINGGGQLEDVTSGTFHLITNYALSGRS